MRQHLVIIIIIINMTVTRLVRDSTNERRADVVMTGASKFQLRKTDHTREAPSFRPGNECQRLAVKTEHARLGWENVRYATYSMRK